jgi:hypothetical protein
MLVDTENIDCPASFHERNRVRGLRDARRRERKVSRLVFSALRAV